MKASRTMLEARPLFTPAMVALGAIHEGHGAFLGGNFIDCGPCRFHAHNGSEGTAVEHDGDYNFTRTYAVADGELKVIEETRKPQAHVTPSYVALHDALTAIAEGGPFPADTAHLSPANRDKEVARRALKGGDRGR